MNQTEPSDLQTMSFGELSGLPLYFDRHGDGAVVFGARDAPGVVFAGEEPALAIASVAVGVVRRLAENADRARLLVPAHDAVVGDVAPQQAAPVAEPDRAFAPAHAGGDPLDAGVGTRYLAKLGSRILSTDPGSAGSAASRRRLCP